LRFKVEQASHGLSAIAELLVYVYIKLLKVTDYIMTKDSD